MKKPEWVKRFEEIEECAPEYLKSSYIITEDDQLHFFPEYYDWVQKHNEWKTKREAKRRATLNSKVSTPD